MRAALENCSAILAMVLPRICVGCALPSYRSDLDLCKYCIPYLPWLENRCYQCGGELGEISVKCSKCRDYPPPFERLCALFKYAAPLKKMIYHLKFGRKGTYARFFGMLLVEQIRTRWYVNCDLPQVIIPVPLHQQRLRKRGYNQAAEIAKFTAQQLGIPLDLQGCVRIRNTQAQARLLKAKRQQNLTRAFIAHTSVRYVALVDDVVTTGSTVRAICIALQNAGVERIDVWSVCRG